MGKKEKFPRFKRGMEGVAMIGTGALTFAVMPVFATQTAIFFTGAGLYNIGMAICSTDIKRHRIMNELFESVGYKNSEGEFTRVKKSVKYKSYDMYYIKIPTGLDVQPLLKMKYMFENLYQNDVEILCDNQDYRVKVYTQKLKDGKEYPFEKVNTGAKDTLKLVIGKCLDGDLIVDLTKTTPHLLLGSMTNMGKSTLVKSILFQLMHNYSPKQLQIIYLDNKGGLDSLDFKHCKHVRFIGQSVDDSVMYNYVWEEEMSKRIELFKSVGAVNLPHYNELVEQKDRLPFQFIVIDELYPFLERDDKAAVYTKIGKLMSMCRAVGIHVMLCSQRTTTDVLDPKITVHCGCKIGLKVSKQQDSKNVIEENGLEDIQAEQVGRGMVAMGGNAVKFQSYWLPNEQIKSICSEFKRDSNDSMPLTSETIQNNYIDKTEIKKTEKEVEKTQADNKEEKLSKGQRRRKNKQIKKQADNDDVMTALN